MKLVIDGQEYPFPQNLTMGEARLIKRYSKLTLDKVKGAGADPDVLAAFCAIALSRQYPDIPEQDIEKRVNALDIGKTTVKYEEGDDAGPPAIPTQNGPLSASEPSGPNSSDGSAARPETTPDSTGAPVSATGATSA